MAIQMLRVVSPVEISVVVGHNRLSLRRNIRKFSVVSSLVVNPVEDAAMSSEKKVYDVVLKQASLVREQLQLKSKVSLELVGQETPYMFKEAYDRCGEVCAEYAKTFYLG